MAENIKPPLHNSSSPRDKEPKELDKLRKWQRDRRERKLRGEYESAIVHLSQVINENLHTSVNISAVRVEGANHTRESFLGSLVAPALSTSNNTTLEEVLHTTRRIAHALKKTDIFTSVEAYVDRPRSNLASPGDVDLVFKTRERGKWYLSSATEVGNNEGSASASARIRNVFGGAETFEANVSLGTKTRRSFRGSLTTPLTSAMDTFGELSVYGMEKDLTTYASCTEGLRGLRAVVRHGTPNAYGGAHELAYDAVIRHISGLTPTASISMRESAGVSLKSSLSHTLLVDTRDDKMAATRGAYGKIFQELAGLALGGDASFYKAEVEGQVSRGLGRGVSISLAARSGLLWGLGPGKTSFSDRFQLGGPTSVRSFRANSMGPRDGADSIGGELYYSAGLSVMSDIYSPKTGKPLPLKAHCWVNAGRLDGVDRDVPLKQTVLASLSRPSLSAGVGLVYRLDPVRVELNFGVPITSSRSDGARRGFQVGMGLEFL